MSDPSGPRSIIVIGGSAGGVEAMTEIARQLPKDLGASVFAVVHTAPRERGDLAAILDRAGPLSATFPDDGQPIQQGRLYVAPPDRHLMLEPGRVRITRGPKQNRVRPAVDVTFSSAADAYGSRVVGVVLTGTQDDGTTGLFIIKRRRGIAVVQDPSDALHPGMPESALAHVAVDYSLPLAEIPALLVGLSRGRAPAAPNDRGARHPEDEAPSPSEGPPIEESLREREEPWTRRGNPRSTHAPAATGCWRRRNRTLSDTPAG